MEQYTANSNSSTEQIVVQAGQIQQQVWEQVCLDHHNTTGQQSSGVVYSSSVEGLGPILTLGSPRSHDWCCAMNQSVAIWYLFFMKITLKLNRPLLAH